MSKDTVEVPKKHTKSMQQVFEMIEVGTIYTSYQEMWEDLLEAAQSWNPEDDDKIR